MQLGKEHQRQIEELIGVITCPEDFVCYKSEFENLAKTRIIGDAKLVECLEAVPMNTAEFDRVYFIWR